MGRRLLLVALSGLAAGCPDDAGWCPAEGCPVAGEEPEPQNGDPCGDIDDTGACDGDVLLYCTDLGLAVTRCADQGQRCAWVEESSMNACVAPIGALPADQTSGQASLGRRGSAHACPAGRGGVRRRVQTSAAIAIAPSARAIHSGP